MSFQGVSGVCVWCLTPIFKAFGADRVLCGYSGGDEVNPEYSAVKKQQTGHREAMAVIYDPEKVTYEILLEIYLANVDPYDGERQYIDRGHSYTLVIYYRTEEQRAVIESRLETLRQSSEQDVKIAVEPLKNFYEAEEYHQDYYLKNPEAFEQELIESGRK